MKRVAALSLLLLAACHGSAPGADSDAGRPPEAHGFPRADRPVATPIAEITSEAQRDRTNEAQSIMDLARVSPGMVVADIGAGEGYYTVRLSPRVGKKGRVLAEDIDPASLSDLGDRVARDNLENVSIQHGADADPHLPDASFDRIFMVHMYHEVSEPYAFLWHLRPALRPGGRVVVVDIDTPTGGPLTGHGLAPAQLFCEFSAVGYRLTEFLRKPEISGYYAEFEAAGALPAPTSIHACRMGTVPARKGVAGKG
jgi:ubiquinone/menaquinone biosynthesis C-methylase UbiE